MDRDTQMVLVMDIKDGSALSILNVRPWLGQNVAFEVLSQEGSYGVVKRACAREGMIILYSFSNFSNKCVCEEGGSLGHGLSGHLALNPPLFPSPMV